MPAASALRRMPVALASRCAFTKRTRARGAAVCGGPPGRDAVEFYLSRRQGLSPARACRGERFASGRHRDRALVRAHGLGLGVACRQVAQRQQRAERGGDDRHEQALARTRDERLAGSVRDVVARWPA
jgi:hypothetical protein